MSFMESPRGHILRFLWKQSSGSFKEMSLDALKEKLVSRGMDEKAFDAELETMVEGGLVVDGSLTDDGLEAMKIEYTKYLIEVDAKAVDSSFKEGIASAKTDFESKHAAVEAARKE